jgi:hypothetical protein
MEQLLKHKIKLVFGRICSGKGNYTKDAECKIVVSNIVRALVSSENREALQNSMHLDNRIAEALLQNIEICLEHYDEVVIDGIRQVSIADRILSMYPDAELIWLEVPAEERKRRYEKRKDVKDVEPFEVADNKPIELECQRIFNTFKNKLTIINNYGINQES